MDLSIQVTTFQDGQLLPVVQLFILMKEVILWEPAMQHYMLFGRLQQLQQFLIVVR